MTLRHVSLASAAGALAALVAALGAAGAAAADDAAGEIRGTVKHRKGAGDLVVFVADASGRFRPPARPAQIDQKGMKFAPFVLPILAGTTVDFMNSDPVSHNVFSPDGEGYNLGTWPPGEKRSYRFTKAGVYTQLCSMHPEMEGYVVVLSNPYFAVTGADGAFTIRGLPDGRCTLKVWGKQLSKAERDRTFPAEVKGGKASVAIEFKR